MLRCLRSLIAAFLGNIVGALFVAIPFTYFYLGDYRAGGLEDAEEGQEYSLSNHRQPITHVYIRNTQARKRKRRWQLGRQADVRFIKHTYMRHTSYLPWS